MKTREEFNEEVFARRDAYMKKRKTRTRRIISVSASAACVVLVAVVAVAGFGRKDNVNERNAPESMNGLLLSEEAATTLDGEFDREYYLKTDFPAPGELAVGSFSYSDDMKYFDGSRREDGFVNTSPKAVRSAEEAVSRAKSEVSNKAFDIGVAFDETEKIWRVDFSDETERIFVYMTEDGITLAVFGEELD